MSNDELYEKALEAIKDLFSDTSVSVDECRRNMESLINEIRLLVDALPYE